MAKGEKVLVCGPSNLSVDNLAERMLRAKCDMVRIGHPARILPALLIHSLDLRISTCDEGQIVQGT